MANRAGKRIRAPLVVGAAVGLLGSSTASAFAQDKSDKLVYGNVLGDIQTAQTANPGRVHVAGTVGVSSADFFRGGFDNIPSDLDEVTFPLELSAMVELWRGRRGFARDLTLTFGTANNVASNDPPTLAEEDEDELDLWYESDNFAALTARLGRNWLAGVTYTIYTNPSEGTTTNEVAAAAQYTGKNIAGNLGLQLKVAVPVEEEDDGVFLQLKAKVPGFKVFQRGDYPLSIDFPVEAGIGVADYYGDGTGTTGYGSLGVTGSVPLAFIPSSEYGGWTLSAGVEVLVRADEIQDLGGEFTDNDTVVPIGSVTLSFMY